jgi:hypothetical protein
MSSVSWYDMEITNGLNKIENDFKLKIADFKALTKKREMRILLWKESEIEKLKQHVINKILEKIKKNWDNVNNELLIFFKKKENIEKRKQMKEIKKAEMLKLKMEQKMMKKEQMALKKKECIPRHKEKRYCPECDKSILKYSFKQHTLKEKHKKNGGYSYEHYAPLKIKEKKPHPPGKPTTGKITHRVLAPTGNTSHVKYFYKKDKKYCQHCEKYIIKNNFKAHTLKNKHIKNGGREYEYYLLSTPKD